MEWGRKIQILVKNDREEDRRAKYMVEGQNLNEKDI